MGGASRLVGSPLGYKGGDPTNVELPLVPPEAQTHPRQRVEFV